MAARRGARDGAVAEVADALGERLARRGRPDRDRDVEVDGGDDDDRDEEQELAGGRRRAAVSGRRRRGAGTTGGGAKPSRSAGRGAHRDQDQPVLALVDRGLGTHGHLGSAGGPAVSEARGGGRRRRDRRESRRVVVARRGAAPQFRAPLAGHVIVSTHTRRSAAGPPRGRDHPPSGRPCSQPPGTDQRKRRVLRTATRAPLTAPCTPWRRHEKVYTQPRAHAQALRRATRS